MPCCSSCLQCPINKACELQQALILSAAQPSELRAWRLQSHRQRITWSIRTLAAFAVSAATEDKKGVVHFPPQADCPDLATIMATLLSALQVLQVVTQLMLSCTAATLLNSHNGNFCSFGHWKPLVLSWSSVYHHNAQYTKILCVIKETGTAVTCFSCLHVSCLSAQRGMCTDACWREARSSGLKHSWHAFKCSKLLPPHLQHCMTPYTLPESIPTAIFTRNADLLHVSS